MSSDTSALLTALAPDEVVPVNMSLARRSRRSSSTNETETCVSRARPKWMKPCTGARPRAPWKKRLNAILSGEDIIASRPRGHNWWQRVQLRWKCNLRDGLPPTTLSDEDVDGLWLHFMDGLGIGATSPAITHIRLLFDRPQVDVGLIEIFRQVSCGRESLSVQDVIRVCLGTTGALHVLLKTAGRVSLDTVSRQDLVWINSNFKNLFPPSNPLTERKFPGMMKFVTVRRVMRTLVRCIGIKAVQSGLRAPLAVNICIDVGQGPMSFQTVAPTSCKNSFGHTLGPMSEEGEEEAIQEQMMFEASEMRSSVQSGLSEWDSRLEPTTQSELDTETRFEAALQGQRYTEDGPTSTFKKELR